MSLLEEQEYSLNTDRTRLSDVHSLEMPFCRVWEGLAASAGLATRD